VPPLPIRELRELVRYRRSLVEDQARIRNRSRSCSDDEVLTSEAEGLITDPDERPVAGALVSVIDQNSYRGVGFSVSDRDGRFSVGLPSTPVVVTATANGHVAGVLVRQVR
jgi:hypothetical protein